MEYRKNDIVTLEIVDCGTDGEGIGKADGFTVFVKDAVIGDIVTAKIMKAKKNYGYGRLMEILKPSPYRVEPVCLSARQCGGCQLQAVSYEEQKELNKRLKKLERRVADCEAEIEQTEAAISILEAKMATPEGASDMALYEQHQKLKAQLDSVMEEWDAVSCELEEARK